jgi:rhodanese-related sulfurtransferase
MHSLLRRGWIDVDDLAAALRDYVVVDVRGAQAFEDGHIAGALSLGYPAMAEGWDDPDPRLPVAVFAEQDGEAVEVAEFLMHQGRDAVVVRGGVRAWRAAGLCLVRNRRR